jgi:hypothetical protein
MATPKKLRAPRSSSRQGGPKPPTVSPALAERAAGLSPEQIITVLAEELDWHASRGDIDKVLSHTHWIPMSRGITARFFDRDWPGWTLGTLIGVFDAAGIRLLPGSGRPGAPHGGRCHWQVKAIHFNDANQFIIEWSGLARDDRRFVPSESAGPRIPAWAERRRAARRAASATTTPPDRIIPVDLAGRVFFDGDTPVPRPDDQ